MESYFWRVYSKYVNSVTNKMSKFALSRDFNTMIYLSVRSSECFICVSVCQKPNFKFTNNIKIARKSVRSKTKMLGRGDICIALPLGPPLEPPPSIGVKYIILIVWASKISFIVTSSYIANSVHGNFGEFDTAQKTITLRTKTKNQFHGNSCL